MKRYPTEIHPLQLFQYQKQCDHSPGPRMSSFLVLLLVEWIKKPRKRQHSSKNPISQLVVMVVCALCHGYVDRALSTFTYNTSHFNRPLSRPSNANSRSKQPLTSVWRLIERSHSLLKMGTIFPSLVDTYCNDLPFEAPCEEVVRDSND